MVGSFGDFEGENDSYTTVVLASYQVVYLYISDFNRVYVISYQVSVVLKFYHFGKKNIIIRKTIIHLMMRYFSGK